MIKVLINGYCGTMGKVIANEIKAEDNMKAVAGVDKKAVNLQDDINVYNDIKDCKEKIDLIIDFSHPSSLPNLLEYGINKNIPIVMGTTGLSDEDLNSIKSASKKIPIFYSANMSLGINLLVSMVKKISPILNETFDIEIIEKHHNKKIDAPSGTAYMIANAINNQLDNSKEYVFDRHTKSQARNKNEIGIHAIRGGTIVGEHSVIYAGTDEVIEIKHSASSKKIFAQGAIKAAKFVYNKESGFYNMEDLFAR